MPEFPPPTISAWLQGRTVSQKKLAKELHEWAQYHAKFLEEEVKPPPDLSESLE